MGPPSFRKHHRFSHSLLPLLIIASRIFLAEGATTLNETNIPGCPSLDCGDGVVIGYPFIPPTGLLGNNDSYRYCGYGELRVTCKDEQPIFATLTDSYIVKGINYATKIISLVDADVVGEDCPRVKHSLNISNIPILRHHSSDVDLLFFFNCSQPNLKIAQYEVACLSQKAGISYVFSDDDTILTPTLKRNLSESCDGSVNSTVLRREWNGIGRNISGLFGTVLGKGFDLQWEEPGSRDCIACEKSGGNCGYENNNGSEGVDFKNCFGRCRGYENNKGSEGVGFPCFCSNGKSDSKDCNRGGLSKWKIVLIALSSVFGAVVVIAAVCFKCFRRREGNKIIFRQTSSTRKSFMKTIAFSLNRFSSNNDEDLESHSSPYLNPAHIFTYKELEDATDGFRSDREIGDGGFGTVYKGFLRDGRTVAVKRLYENNHKRLEQFLNEVKILEPLRHPNLVTLYGCTSRHSRELLLVYEFVSNGTIADHLHGPRADERALTWPLRMKTAIETADALAHLHAIEPPIIHRDVKTNNILLDNSFHVKVADFGLSRLFPLDVTHVSTAPQGTPGYVDPEYYQCYQLTDKSDVYSLGVVLVELISSKPAVDIARRRRDINLSKMAIDRIPQGLVHELSDPELGYETDPEVKRQIEAVAEVAFLCLQSDKDMRPPMKVVKVMLSDIVNEKVDCKDKKYIVDDEKQVKKDDAGLLIPLEGPISPDTVTSKWYSRATTPNTSA